MKFSSILTSIAVLAASVACSTPADKIADVIGDNTLALAEECLGRTPVTVTAYTCERSQGGIHDFYSEGDYWWPDPDNPDGPYIRRDGESNPDNFSEHRHAMVRFSETVGALTSAWLLTGDRKYAEAAEKHLRAWFIDGETMMNPHMLYAQGIKGRVSGRGIGIIDTIHLIEVAQSVKRLAEGGAISGECAAGCRGWFASYLEWLNTHKYGQDEKKAKNNHGTWWFAQVASFASLVGDEAQMDECRTAYKERFLPETMDADGSFPDELKRTKPYNYSVFQLDAMALLCQVLSTSEDDLWSYTTSDGRNIRLGLDFLTPYVADKSTWPYQQDIVHWDEWPVAIPSFALAWNHFRDERYFAVWEPYDHFPTGDEMRRNIALRNPLIWII